MSSIKLSAFIDDTQVDNAAALASLLDAAVEITKAYAESASEKKFLDKLPDAEFPAVLEAIFNKLKKIADANKVE